MSFAIIMPKRDFAKEADDLTHYASSSISHEEAM